MELNARDHVPGLTGLLSVISLSLVFGAVLGYIPESVLPHIDALVELVPHLNAVISVTAIVTILYGIRSIRRGNIARHRAAMLSTTALFASFLVLYLYRVSLVGPTTFAGPTWVKQFLYLPLLAIHILLAIACIPLVYYALLLAATRPVSDIPQTAHRRFGRLAAAFWLVSFSLGIAVYLTLHVLF